MDHKVYFEEIVMNMIKLVAFDLDGTLADTIPMSIESFRLAVTPYADHTLSREEIVEMFGLNEPGMIKAIVKDRWEEALRDYYRLYEQMHTRCEVPFDGIVPLIRELKRRGAVVSLITGKSERSCRITLKRLGLEPLFSDIIPGSEDRNHKGEHILSLLEKYGLSKDECVYIGDAVSDVTASREAGVRCLSAAWSSSADRDALREVNPEDVYERVADLERVLRLMTEERS